MTNDPAAKKTPEGKNDRQLDPGFVYEVHVEIPASGNYQLQGKIFVPTNSATEYWAFAASYEEQMPEAIGTSAKIKITKVSKSSVFNDEPMTFRNAIANDFPKLYKMSSWA